MYHDIKSGSLSVRLRPCKAAINTSTTPCQLSGTLCRILIIPVIVDDRKTVAGRLGDAEDAEAGLTGLYIVGRSLR